MQLRAEQGARMNTAITAATTTAIGIWTPLGPAPLASDATGFGQQDYGWVSGRATAGSGGSGGATGNTLFIAGAPRGGLRITKPGAPCSNTPYPLWVPPYTHTTTPTR